MIEKNGFILFNTSDEFNNYLSTKTFSRSIKYIQLHHTWKPDCSDFNNNHFELAFNMKDYHVNILKWADIAQNIAIFPDGKIMICRSLEKDPAGIYGFNKNALCIENIGNFDNSDVNTDQKNAIINTCKILCKKFNISNDTDHIVYHHWFDLDTGKRTNGIGNTKTCPGTKFFGGNGIADCQNNFIPLVKGDVKKVNNEDWKLDGLKELVKEGLILEYDQWANKINENIPAWAVFIILDRIYKKLKG